jgi:hypothetical protein
MRRPSITGYLTKSPDVARFESYIKVQKGSLYYDPEFGFDMKPWLTGRIPFNSDSFSMWLIGEAARVGIALTKVEATFEDFQLTIRYEVVNQDPQSISIGV